MSIIKSENLVHRFSVTDENDNVIEENSALDGVNIEVEEGQFIAILGHNGSGKSTFARHINALLTPDEGTLYVNGWDTKDESKLWEIRQNAGMVFQNPDNQIIASVVEEDVGFGPENIGVPTEQIWDRVNRSLKAVGMSKYRNHSFFEFFGFHRLVISHCYYLQSLVVTYIVTDFYEKVNRYK